MKKIAFVPVLFISMTIFLILTAGCSNQKSLEKKEQQAQNQEERTGKTESKKTESYQEAAKTAAGPGYLFGKAKEVMNSGGYTYILLDFEGQETWIAMPETNVAVGDELMIQPGDEMKDFHSNTLNRTFDTIIFSPGLVTKDSKNNQQNMGSGMGMGQMMGGMGSGHTGPPKLEKVVAKTIEKPAAENAISVEQAHAQAKKLNGKSVTVRGQVVKVSKNIMGKNWIHIQDGTGTPEQANYDLTITTKQDAKTGEIITATGTLAADKNFGAGYFYPVIIEDATITR